MNDCKKALDRHKMDLDDAAYWLTENAIQKNREMNKTQTKLTLISVSLNVAQ